MWEQSSHQVGATVPKLQIQNASCTAHKEKKKKREKLAVEKKERGSNTQQRQASAYVIHQNSEE
jgi:hypothetical protein